MVTSENAIHAVANDRGVRLSATFFLTKLTRQLICALLPTQPPRVSTFSVTVWANFHDRHGLGRRLARTTIVANLAASVAIRAYVLGAHCTLAVVFGLARTTIVANLAASVAIRANVLGAHCTLAVVFVRRSSRLRSRLWSWSLLAAYSAMAACG